MRASSWPEHTAFSKSSLGGAPDGTFKHSDVFHLSASHFKRLQAEYGEFREVLKAVSADKSEKLADLVLDGCVL